MEKYLPLALAIFATAMSPAFAQSFNPRDGTGNVLPYSYQSQAPAPKLVPAPGAAPGAGLYLYVPEYDSSGGVVGVKRPHPR